MTAGTIAAATAAMIGGEGGHDAIADYLTRNNLVSVSVDSLARACNLAGVGYTDFLKIRAYLPPLPAAPAKEGL